MVEMDPDPAVEEFFPGELFFAAVIEIRYLVAGCRIESAEAEDLVSAGLLERRNISTKPSPASGRSNCTAAQSVFERL